MEIWGVFEYLKCWRCVFEELKGILVVGNHAKIGWKQGLSIGKSTSGKHVTLKTRVRCTHDRQAPCKKLALHAAPVRLVHASDVSQFHWLSECCAGALWYGTHQATCHTTADLPEFYLLSKTKRILFIFHWILKIASKKIKHLIFRTSLIYKIFIKVKKDNQLS